MADVIVSATSTSHQVAALERLATLGTRKTAHARWYEPGKDFCFYAAAQNAIRVSKGRVSKLKLTSDEKRLLVAPPGTDEIENRLRQIAQEQERKLRKTKLQKRSSDFVNGFCAFTVKVSGLVGTMLPQTPEYTVTYGLIVMLFMSVVTKKDREESLLQYLQSLADKLPVVDFYRNTFPTDDMKLAVANIYVEVMKLLDEALVYYRSGRLGKLVDAVLSPTENKFDAYIANVDTEMKKMETLKTVAHEAQTADIKDVVKDTGLGVARIYDTVDRSSTAIGMSIELLNERMNTLELHSSRMLGFETIMYSQGLREILLPDGWDADDELDKILHRGFRLSPKDHWENNGVLDDLLAWSKGPQSSFLWVGGNSGNQDPWITELAADIVQALKPQPVSLLHIFCEFGPKDGINPIRLVKELIAQVLSLHPEVAYQNPQVFNEWRFRRAITFTQVWRIFEQLALAILDLFIIIDRVEECQADEQADLTNQLLPSLAQFIERSGTTRLIVTSVFDPPDELRDTGKLQDVYIDTSKSSMKRNK